MSMHDETAKLRQTANVTRRHLVLLIDGTWIAPTRKQINQQQSNVFWFDMFLEAVNEKNEAQVAFYIPGIGAAATNGDKWLSGGLAYGLERLVEAAYLNLVSNFHENDQIYIIGFSRGAVIARIVAFLISEFGILKQNNVQHYDSMWKFVKGEDSKSKSDWVLNSTWRPDIRFLGLFDTVPGAWAESYWRERGHLKETFFHKRLLPRKVKNALHILSMHECRLEFRPVPFEGVESPDKQRLEQIWMPGVHSDVGGGYRADFLGNIALLTLIDRVSALTGEDQENGSLKLDRKRLEELMEHIKQGYETQDIIVNNELGSMWQWPLSRLCHALGVAQRRPKKEDKFQFYHEICNRIDGYPITVRRKTLTFKMEDFRDCDKWLDLPFKSVPLLDQCLPHVKSIGRR